MNKTVQAKSISDADALAAMRACRGMHGVPHCASLWDIQAHLSAYPEKVVRAKLASLVKRGLLEGTAQDGCRGDFEIPGEVGHAAPESAIVQPTRADVLLVEATRNREER